MKRNIQNMKAQIHELSAEAYFYKIELEKYKNLYVEEMNYRTSLLSELNM